MPKIILKRDSIFEALTSTSFLIDGEEISNSAVPYQFSVLVATGLAKDRKTFYHAGLELKGAFAYDGSKFEHALVDWWPAEHGVRIRFFDTVREVREAVEVTVVRERTGESIPLEFKSETRYFETRATAATLLEIARKELKRESVWGRVPSPGQLREGGCDGETNCCIFALRTALALNAGCCESLEQLHREVQPRSSNPAYSGSYGKKH